MSQLLAPPGTYLARLVGCRTGFSSYGPPTLESTYRLEAHIGQDWHVDYAFLVDTFALAGRDEEIRAEFALAMGLTDGMADFGEAVELEPLLNTVLVVRVAVTPGSVYRPRIAERSSLARYLSDFYVARTDDSVGWSKPARP